MHSGLLTCVGRDVSLWLLCVSTTFFEGYQCSMFSVWVDECHETLLVSLVLPQLQWLVVATLCVSSWDN